MTSADDWTLIPREGLGKLRFGMSPEQVDALSGSYGTLTGRMSDRIPDDILRDTLEQFGDALSEQEKQELVAAYAENAPPGSMVTETRGDPGLVLQYDKDRLVEIMPAIGQHPLYLDGRDLFSLSGRDALALLENLNGGPGRYAGTEAAFDELAISADGFCDTGPEVRALDDTDERFRGRTLVLRAEPYLPEAELGRYVTHRFVD